MIVRATGDFSTRPQMGILVHSRTAFCKLGTHGTLSGVKRGSRIVSPAGEDPSSSPACPGAQVCQQSQACHVTVVTWAISTGPEPLREASEAQASKQASNKESQTSSSMNDLPRIVDTATH